MLSTVNTLKVLRTSLIKTLFFVLLILLEQCLMMALNKLETSYNESRTSLHYVNVHNLFGYDAHFFIISNYFN